MTRFFSADFHINHARIIEYAARPFRDVEEMQREIIARHNAVVKPGDVVYNLGDFAFHQNIIPEVLRQLNGEHHLISGNHDKTHPVHKKYLRHIKEYLAYGFKTVQESLELQIANRTVLLSHLPYLHEGEYKIRYKEERPIDHGQFLLCGHVHTAFKVRGRMINVGVDVWDFTPVSEVQVSELIADILEYEQV